MTTTHDPIPLFRFALESGDEPLADLIWRRLSSNRVLTRRMDAELKRCRRAPPRPSRAAGSSRCKRPSPGAVQTLRALVVLLGLDQASG